MPEQLLPPWAVTPERLRAAVGRLVDAASPNRIILFGSHARGDADARSDVDLLIVAPQVTDRYAELVRLDRALAGSLLPVDLLLVSEAEFEHRCREPGTVEHAAHREGRVLYDAA